MTDVNTFFYEKKDYSIFQSLFLVSSCIQVVSFDRFFGAKTWKRDLCECHVPRLLRELLGTASKFNRTANVTFLQILKLKYHMLSIL